ncbi:Putative transposase of IS4/5 family [Thermomonospora echinospora]|uniref:Putative transposase of IS4/5 family n=1 Tax=Thermomonospora echinospora TaxID=1992 RepID=A0A1H6E1K3_9ACTN|nr:Putative transposase of IS4/5 family [Thermomonospora echinospora]
MVERMVPDELREMFQRVVPPAPTRPQGGGRRRYGDREVPPAIIFVAASGCTWRQLPPMVGPSGPTAVTAMTTALVVAECRIPVVNAPLRGLEERRGLPPRRRRS